MKIVHDLIGAWRRVGALASRRRRDHDLDDELAFHLAMRQAEHERAGATPEAARHTARREFGNLTSLKEQTADMWKFLSFESLVQDVRLRPPQLVQGSRLQSDRRSRARDRHRREHRHVQPRRSDAAARAALPRGRSVGAAHRDGATCRRRAARQLARRSPGLAREGEPFRRHRGLRARPRSRSSVSTSPSRSRSRRSRPRTFRCSASHPRYGRTFHESEDAVPDRDFVAVLSDGLWRRRFGGDPSIVNRTIQLSGQAYTVVGIMPPGFTGLTDNAQLWVPFSLSGFAPDDRGTADSSRSPD